MVDIPRKINARLRLMLRILYIAVGLGAISGISWYVSRLKPAAPTVDRATVWIDVVKRGTLPRQVRGMGKLVPEEIRWVPAATEGTVERKLLQPGARVTPATILIELSNPQLKQETVNAEWDWKAEQSAFEDLRVKLERERLTQEAETVRLQSEYDQAVLKYNARAELERNGLFPTLDLKQDEAAVNQLASRLKLEKQRTAIFKESATAQLSQGQTRIEKSRAAYGLKKSQFDQLMVRAGVDGVLQQMEIDVGRHVSMGTSLARVANPNKLKAELSITETQAKDIQLGQEVSVDTRNGIIPGKVSRIDPAVKDGSVAVDVRLEAELPKGARPDLSVDGTILIEELRDVIYVGRPVQGQPDGQVGLFKLTADGKRAERITVKLGRSSVNAIEVKEGLKPGDKVILSDMSEKDGFDEIRLN